MVIASVLALLISTGAAIALWLRNKGAARMVAVRVSVSLFVGVVTVAISGVPLFLSRVRHVRFTPAVVNIGHTLHHYLGHLLVWVTELSLPFLFVVAVGRPQRRWCKLILGLATLIVAYVVLFASFTGYLLPPGQPRQLTPSEIAHTLRFIVLHVVVAPIVAAIGFLVITWRHVRRSTAA